MWLQWSLKYFPPTYITIRDVRWGNLLSSSYYPNYSRECPLSAVITWSLQGGNIAVGGKQGILYILLHFNTHHNSTWEDQKKSLGRISTLTKATARKRDSWCFWAVSHFKAPFPLLDDSGGCVNAWWVSAPICETSIFPRPVAYLPWFLVPYRMGPRLSRHYTI